MKTFFPFLCTFFMIIGFSLFGSTLLNTMAKEETSPVYHKYYTSVRIKEGDSLWSLAAKYNLNSGKSTESYIKEVKSINRLLEDTIHEGNYLTIIYYSKEVK